MSDEILPDYTEAIQNGMPIRPGPSHGPCNAYTRFDFGDGNYVYVKGNYCGRVVVSINGREREIEFINGDGTEVTGSPFARLT